MGNTAASASSDGDEYGKTVFPNAPYKFDGPYYVGTVTPVVHYTMGGIEIDSNCAVVDDSGKAIPGLHAAGEVVGGIHGKNRLGGNALTECIVFGQRVGNAIADTLVQDKQLSPKAPVSKAEKQQSGDAASGSPPANRKVSQEELKNHDTEEKRSWVSIQGTVYDFTDFLDEHPAGKEAILELAGKDGTDEFLGVHTMSILDDFDDLKVGVLA